MTTDAQGKAVHSIAQVTANAPHVMTVGTNMTVRMYRRIEEDTERGTVLPPNNQAQRRRAADNPARRSRRVIASAAAPC